MLKNVKAFTRNELDLALVNFNILVTYNTLHITLHNTLYNMLTSLVNYVASAFH